MAALDKFFRNTWNAQRSYQTTPNNAAPATSSTSPAPPTPEVAELSAQAAPTGHGVSLTSSALPVPLVHPTPMLASAAIPTFVAEVQQKQPATPISLADANPDLIRQATSSELTSDLSTSMAVAGAHSAVSLERHSPQRPPPASSSGMGSRQGSSQSLSSMASAPLTATHPLRRAGDEGQPSSTSGLDGVGSGFQQPPHPRVNHSGGGGGAGGRSAALARRRPSSSDLLAMQQHQQQLQRQQASIFMQQQLHAEHWNYMMYGGGGLGPVGGGYFLPPGPFNEQQQMMAFQHQQQQQQQQYQVMMNIMAGQQLQHQQQARRGAAGAYLAGGDRPGGGGGSRTSHNGAPARSSSTVSGGTAAGGGGLPASDGESQESVAAGVAGASPQVPDPSLAESAQSNLSSGPEDNALSKPNKVNTALMSAPPSTSSQHPYIVHTHGNVMDMGDPRMQAMIGHMQMQMFMQPDPMMYQYQHPHQHQQQQHMHSRMVLQYQQQHVTTTVRVGGGGPGASSQGGGNQVVTGRSNSFPGWSSNTLPQQQHQPLGQGQVPHMSRASWGPSTVPSEGPSVIAPQSQGGGSATSVHVVGSPPEDGGAGGGAVSPTSSGRLPPLPPVPLTHNIQHSPTSWGPFPSEHLKAIAERKPRVVGALEGGEGKDGEEEEEEEGKSASPSNAEEHHRHNESATPVQGPGQEPGVPDQNFRSTPLSPPPVYHDTLSGDWEGLLRNLEMAKICVAAVNAVSNAPSTATATVTTGTQTRESDTPHPPRNAGPVLMAPLSMAVELPAPQNPAPRANLGSPQPNKQDPGSPTPPPRPTASTDAPTAVSILPQPPVSGPLPSGARDPKESLSIIEPGGQSEPLSLPETAIWVSENQVSPTASFPHIIRS